MSILHKAAATAALGLFMATNALAANLITNGTFEAPSVGSAYASYAAGSTGIMGWAVDSTPADGVQLLSSANEASFSLPNNGTQVLQLTGGPGNVYSVGGGVNQAITTTPNQIYTVSIDVASRNGSPVSGNLSFGGQNHVITSSSQTCTTLAWQVIATNTSPVIDITGSTSSASVQLIIDNVSVSPPVGPVSAETSTIVASPNSIPANGTTTTTITVSLQDANGNPVTGKTVTLTSSRGAADAISAASGPSSASGIVTFTVQSTTPGMAVFSATDATDNLTLASTAAVFVYDVGAKGPQASPIPIVFDQTATNDNLVVLMAAGSEYSSDLTLYQDGPSNYPKHFWINNWSNSTNDYFKWNIALATGAVYHVYAKLSAGAAVPLQLSIAGTNTVLDFTTRNIGWDKLDCGTINIPSGTNQLVLRKNTTDTSQVLSIKSLELIRESDLPAYQQRVANFRADTTWLSQSKYGLMTQFGAWGYPPTGPQPSLQNMANGFNVSSFVNLVTNTGCKYVIFSITWYTYQMLAPIQSVDQIVPGDTNITSTRDVIGELATALHAAGVRFMLYYHCGSDSQSPGGYDSTPWWQAQEFPEPSFTEQAAGDRSVFFTNWCNVITEIGNRYGTNLDGWFIDDGMVYYPAPFEKLGQAARAGNPNRLICYNPWIATEYTDFQDVFMGENSQGQSQFGSTPAGGNGIFTDGPQVGLLQHGMFPMEQDWGIHEENQPITTQITASQAIGWVESASARGVPLSFNMMLWSDQTYSTNSLNVLLNLKSAIYGGSSASLSSNNLVVNGTFATPSVSSGITNFMAGSTAMYGWTVDAAPSDGVQLGAEGTFGPDNGSQNLQLTGGGNGGGTYSVGGGISQTIATTPGATYTVIIDVASRQGNAITGNFSFGGQNHAISVNSPVFTTLTWKAIATGTNTLLNITGYTNSANGQLLIDNVSVTPFFDPDITAEPASQTAIFGGTASFDVSVAGTAPFSYQWYFDTNTAIPGATNDTLTLTKLEVSGTINVVVTNTIGSKTSSFANLTLVTNIPIAIGNYSFELQNVPQGSYTSYGMGAPTDWSATNVAGAVVALVDPGIIDGRGYGSNPMGLNGINYAQIYAYQAGGTGVVYQDTGVKYQAGTIYALSSAFGLENGNFATGSSFGLYNSSLTPIAIKTISSNSLNLGTFTNIAISYTGTGSEGGNGDIIVGFAMPSSTTNSAFFDFDNVTLVAGVPIAAPSITNQPVGVTTNSGSSVSFNVVAGGTAPLKYQWYFDTNTPISGATNATLSLTNVQSGGTYDVVVSNAYASITTSTAKLTVLPNPPTSLTATSGVNSITLSYPAVANAKFYTIYRSKVSGVSYSKIATTTATKYTDLNVIKGISYYYVVGSCDGVNLSGYSKQATAASH